MKSLYTIRCSFIIKQITLLALLALTLHQTATAQTDTVFWFAAPEVAYIGNPFPPCDRPIVVRLRAYNQAATVTISQPANGGLPIQVVNVPANTIKTVDLTNWIDNIETKPTNTAVNYGLKISSDVSVAAYYEEVSGGNVGYFPDPEIFNLKGQYALGNDFWIPAQNMLSNDSIRFSSLLSSFNIVATEDNTSITVTPRRNVIGHAANVPFLISLDRGQTFAVTAVSPSASGHLNGSRVVSDKPIAITVSDDGPAYSTGGDDLGGDQIVPTKYLGKEYVAINSLLNTPGDVLFVIATEDNTMVYKDGVYISTINAGETQQILLNENASYITTSAPSAVWQLSGVGVQTGQLLLPKLNCTGSKSVSFVRSVEGDLLLNIVVHSGGENGFSVNGNSNVLTNGQFSAVPGTGGAWMYCRLSLPLGSYPLGSNIKVDNSKTTFQMGVINGYTERGTDVSYFADFNNGSTGADITAQPNPACVGDNIQLSTTNDPGASYSWQGPNGFSSNVYNPLLSNVDTSDAGTYTVRIDKAGTGCNSIGSVAITINPLPVVDLGQDTSVCEGDRITLQTKGVYPTALYNWNTGANTQAIQVSDSGTYSLSITSPPDCKGSDAVHVATHHCDCYVHIPNAFSPNGDGRNDVFAPGLEISCPIDKYLLRIYNRYGQMIFSSANRDEGWDGYYNHKKADLGTYFFYITYEEYGTGIKKSFKGDLTLIR